MQQQELNFRRGWSLMFSSELGLKLAVARIHLCNCVPSFSSETKWTMTLGWKIWSKAGYQWGVVPSCHGWSQLSTYWVRMAWKMELGRCSQINSGELCS